MKPKLHKEGVPGRPVTSSVNCHISKVSECVDYHLQPIVREIPSMSKTKVTSYEKLPQFNSSHTTPTYLILLDINVLFISIPNAEGVKAVKSPSTTIQSKQWQQR